MDPNELIKVAPEIAKGAGALAAAIPFTAIVKRMLGPAADEVAQMWVDQVRVYRYGRQLKLMEKAEKMAQDAGFTPQAVPPKILFPLLEGASFEEDENMHDMWAALLANAASPDGMDKVRPGLIAILRQMAPDEASLLNALFNESADLRETFPKRQPEYSLLITGETVNKMSQGLGQTLVTCGICLDRLQAQYLIQRRFDAKFEAYLLTFSCFQFMTACRPPVPKK